MKYYQVGLNPEPKIIGVTNGITQVKLEEDKLDLSSEFKSFFTSRNNSFWDNQEAAKFIIKPHLTMSLLKKAKMTDIMGYSPTFFTLDYIYSDNLVKIFNGLNTNIISFFNVKIIGNTTPYYLVFFNSVMGKEIDFQNSIVRSSLLRNDNVTYLDISSYEELRASMLKYPLYKFERISIPRKYEGLDIISLQPQSNHFYSERIIESITNAGITGFSIYYETSPELLFN